MRKLMRANFERIRRSGLFWGEIIIWIGICFLEIEDDCRRAEAYDLPLLEMFQQSMFSHTVVMGIMFTVFISLFVGTEYSDGTIRNKLIVGQPRSSIYLSNFITCMAAGTVQLAAAVTTFLAVEILLTGELAMEPGKMIKTCVILLFLCMSYVSVYNLVSMLVSSRSHAAVVNILLAFAFLFVAAYLSSSLSAPEMMTDYSILADGSVLRENKVPNPEYISGTQRAVYQFLMDFLPGGQNLEVANSSYLVQLLEHPALSCFYSAVIAVVSNITGMIMFDRKDIK